NCCFHHVIIAVEINDGEVSYTNADNRVIVATDSSERSFLWNRTPDSHHRPPSRIPERFVVHLGTHIVSKYAHIHKAFVDIERLRWSRIVVVFRDGDEKRTVKVKVDGTAGKDKIQARARAVVNDLMVFRIFFHIIRDEYTLLKEVDDRIFSTSVDLNYRFTPIRISPPQDENKLDIVIPALDQAEAGSVWDATVLDRARTITFEVFAEDESASVQATLYKMGQRIIAENASVQSVTSDALPNKHYIPVDMSHTVGWII
ncbi:uricase, partial [Lentinula edodes]